VLRPTGLWVLGQVGKLKRPVVWETVLVIRSLGSLLSCDRHCSSWMESLSPKGGRVSAWRTGAGEAGGMASWMNSWCPGGLGLGLGRSASGPGHLPLRFPGAQKRHLLLISD